MNVIEEILLKVKDKFSMFLGWLELVLKTGFDQRYRYRLEYIDFKEQDEKYHSIVHYKLVGCRKIEKQSAVQLNKSAMFSLFRSDHAQIIVSIAAIEAMMNLSKNEIINKLKEYIENCNRKLDGRE